MTKTKTALLTEYASSTAFAALPEAVIDRTKKVIFDEIACAYFGRRSAAGDLSARYARDASGAAGGEARIYGTRLSVSAPFAALANGTAGHGEEVDGAHVVGGHPGASIVHAAMAMAERQRTTGAELINAVALGYDVGIRIVAACGGKFVVRDTHHITSDSFYTFGATAAASRLLGLDAPRTAHALALASFQTNGLYALYSEKRHISKSFCNGQYAFAGVSAAIMSMTGLEGNEDIMGSSQGLLTAWGAEGKAEELVRAFGTEFSILGANFKFFNAGYPIHTPVEAAMTLIAEHGLSGDDIAAVTVGMAENTRRVVDGRAMHNICVQDMVAASIATGGLEILDQPFPAILREPAYQRLRACIEVEVDPEIQRDLPDGRGARVTITTTDGRTLSKRVDHPRGHSRRGEVSWDDLAEKWTRSLPNCDVATALTVARTLESLDDVTTLAKAFAGEMV
ncbi:MmgE/PrpD family protein [Salipiger sp.]|uniref:MmgE/PrpD family protein n=1 Tax=Salipiger sp. TaxID=2078585 RepID=UPI003A96DBFB